ncbi:MAG TPA: xanthine dehydrogenase family protein subunit M [Pseudonocardia sp.]|jgi:carbon-monoxide dehydrogenase medium subunit
MQVPAQFEYQRATSVADAIALLTRHGPESRVVAGGHSLIPMMKLRLAQPEMLIDINGVEELAQIRIEAAGEGTELRIGALVRHADLLASPLVAEHFPIFVDAERVIADPIVRNRGTVGGSLCQADPSEDLAAAFAAVRAVAVIAGPDGERTVPVRGFHTGPYQTEVGDAELLTELRVPIRPGGGSCYLKVERRVGDWPVAAACAAIRLADGGTVAEIGIGLTAVGADHFVAAEAERYLLGHPAGEERFVEAGRLAAEHCRPTSDQRGPAGYKRHLAGELTTRALRRATARALGHSAGAAASEGR